MVWGATIPTNSRVVRAGAHFMVARTLYYALPLLMGPWVRCLLGTYSSYTQIIANQKCVYGQVSGALILTNCRVVRADGHFLVARTLYGYGSLGPRDIGYI